ncbi:MAG TPA: DUF5615 family PIN-like protein [Myxococcota bacterium]|nr:DUF5615 family PIN-like protein [Myxococcota bacterium]
MRVIRKKVRFLVDETLGESVAAALRRRGWNAKTVADAGLGGHDDHDVFMAAWRERRFILTQDRDFLDRRRFPFHRCHGVFVLPGESINSDVFVAAYLKVLSIFAPYSREYEGARVLVHSDEIVIYRADSRDRFKLGRPGEVFAWG